MPKVQDLLALKSFQGAVCVAGNRGLGREVRDISVMEVPDIEDFVKPGDFLVTTLFAIHDKAEALDTLIPKLAAAGLSGLGVKLNRYLEHLPGPLLTQADKLGFPVLQLPGTSNFSLQINDYLTESNHQKSLELQYRNMVHTQMMESMLQGEEYEGLAHNLGRLLEKTVVLYDASLEVLAGYSHRDDFAFSLDDISGDNAHSIARLGSSSFVSLKLETGCAVFYRVRYGAERGGYIVVGSERQFALSALEKMAVEQFSIVFRILIQRQRTMNELELRYIEGFTGDLLYGKITSTMNATSRAKALGWKMTYPLSVLLLDIAELPRRVSDRMELVRALNKHLGSRGGWSLFFSTTHQYVVGFLDEAAGRQWREVLDAVRAELGDMGVERFCMGVSRPAAGAGGISSAYREARKALEVAELTRSEDAMHFRDIGVYRIIHSARDKKDLEEFCLDTIGPLLDYDRERGASLLDTLSVIIEQSGNLKEAAATMYLHYNTLRYRYRLIQQVLQKELNTISDYNDINLAIKIYRTLHMGEE